MQRRHYLVTGGSGFLGRYIVGGLVAQGEAVTVLGRRPVEGAAYVPGDLCDAQIEPGPACDVVVHAAGLAHVVPQTEEESARFFAVNAEGTKRLLHALKRAGRLPQAVVLVSTVAVYGRQTGTLLDEDTPRAASDPYGLSKRMAEDTLTAWGAECGVRTGIVRLPLVAGHGAPGNLGALIEALARGRYLNVGGGAARRSMVRAEDVAAILPEVARVGGVYHLTDGYHPSYAALSAALAEALGRRPPRNLPLPLARLGARLGDAVEAVTGRRVPLSRRTVTKLTSTLTFSDTRARQALGWHPAAVLDHVVDLIP